MKTPLACTFWVESSSNQKSKGRPTKGCLALAKAEEGRCYLVLSSKLNNHPRKIGLDRFQSLVEAMKQKGMATIQFVDPPTSVFVSKAIPNSLEAFLNRLVAVAVDDRDSNVVLKEMGNTEAVQYQCDSSLKNGSSCKLSIKSREQYASLRGLPPRLEHLIVTKVGLCNVDMRWFSLQHLQFLSLAGNQLGHQWKPRFWRRFAAISKLAMLHTLDLSENKFQKIPDFFIDALPTSLLHLNLSSNRLTILSNRILRLYKLNSLKLDGNPLEELPEDLFLLSNLAILTLSGSGQLRFLPASMFLANPYRKQFQMLDVSNCKKAPFYTGEQPKEAHEQQGVHRVGGGDNELNVSAPPTLCELASAAVLNNSALLDPRSRLLRPEVSDCLPSLMRHHLRLWLRRCGQCLKLYAPPSPSSPFSGHLHRVQLRDFTYHLQGPSPAFVRLQLCVRCTGRGFGAIR